MPLNVHEVEQLIAAKGKGLLKSQRNMDHFLTRALATLRGYRQQMQHLHREIQQSQLAAEHGGAPTTLHPIDSFRYLSEAEKKRVMDQRLSDKYDAMIAELQAAEAARTETDDDLVRDMVGVLTSMCARLYGRRGARNRAEKALWCAANDVGPSSETVA